MPRGAPPVVHLDWEKGLERCQIIKVGASISLEGHQTTFPCPQSPSLGRVLFALQPQLHTSVHCSPLRLPCCYPPYFLLECAKCTFFTGSALCALFPQIFAFACPSFRCQLRYNFWESPSCSVCPASAALTVSPCISLRSFHFLHSTCYSLKSLVSKLQESRALAYLVPAYLQWAEQSSGAGE